MSDWRVRHPDRDIEYLVKNPNYNYQWVNSSAGEDVKNQLLVGRRVEKGFWRVGRIVEGGFTYIAKIFPGGAHYESGEGREMVAESYQILTCTPENQEDIKDTEILVLVIFLAFLFTIVVIFCIYFGILYRHKYLKIGEAVIYQKF